ncbi:MAG: SEC-C domain-containing protein, partial [Bacteroidales bacterium]|nr:SEC-C domain-containing protein [Bacteroidales bacterium]
VMNNQRTVIYNKRRNALYGDRLPIDISNTFYDTCEVIFNDARQNRDFEALKLDMIRTFAVDLPFEENELFGEKRDVAIDKLYHLTYDNFKARMQRICQLAYPFIKNVHEKTQYQNIAFPVTDGKKTLNVIVPVQKAFDTQGREMENSIQKSITLAIIDDYWKEHLRELDELRTSVQNASYEQKDPLLIYKFESFNLFEKMLLDINRDISSFLSRASLPIQQENEVREAHLPQSDDRHLRTSRSDDQQRPGQNTQERQKPQPVHVEKKVGRNDPCPCGSGKKYKNCHGRNIDE